MRRIVLSLAAVGVAILIASGVALAAVINGTNGPDTLTGTDEADTIRGDDGADTISGMGSSDTIYGGHGPDTLYGNDERQTPGAPGGDHIEGRPGDDTIVGSEGADVIYGDEDADTIVDGPEDDAAVDHIYGGINADEITSANSPASRDVVGCGDGTDTVVADALDDISANCENVSKLVTEEQALEQDASMYATDFGVSVEEAKRRLELQDDVGELGAKLEANEVATYGGIEIVHQPEFRVVVYFTVGGELTIGPYVVGTPLEGIVEVRKVSATLKELEAAQEAAMGLYEERGITVESDINVTQNRAEIYVTQADQAEAQLVSLPPHVEVITVDSFMPPAGVFFAGHPLQLANGTLWCTSGFTVRHIPSNAEGTLTAGHCPPRTDDNYDDLRNLFYGERVLPFQQQDLNGSQDVQWHTTPNIDDRAWFRASSRYDIRKLLSTKGRPNQEVGDYACKYGRRTGYSCGKIEGKWWAPSFVTDANRTFMRVQKTSSGTMAAPGDSGGPVFLNNTALGITVAGDNDELGYMAINYAVDNTTYLDLKVQQAD